MNDAAIARMPTSELFGLRMKPLPMDGALTATGPLDSCSSALVGPRPRLFLHGRGSPQRSELETFIRNEYREHFDADVREFMPTFLALHDAAGRISAAVGCRSAALEPLFLEVYTEQPIERMIEMRAGAPVPRDRIVEIGSLACRDGRAAMAIIRALAPYLIEAGFSWVAFTGADTVVNVLRRMNLEPLALCVADSSRLGASRLLWGSYYDHDPVVMAGRLTDGLDAMGSAPGLQ